MALIDFRDIIDLFLCFHHQADRKTLVFFPSRTVHSNPEIPSSFNFGIVNLEDLHQVAIVGEVYEMVLLVGGSEYFLKSATFGVVFHNFGDKILFEILVFYPS